MDDFIAGQRWVSTTEPELGLGQILEVGVNRITVVFPACVQQRIYARNNAPLGRAQFTVGETIEDTGNCQLNIAEIIEQNGLLTYIGVNERGQTIRLHEANLNHHIQFNKPQERLFTGQIDPFNWFRLRHQTWLHLQRLQQSKVRGLMGGRTALLAHQIYIAFQAANRYAPRIMLADEVGLGKTIEAGLILQYRIIHGLSCRILIIVPESLQHQWLVEMLRRFNLYFSIFDEQRCAQSQGENPFLSEQRVLCSQDFFLNNPDMQQQALQTEWDIVVVDEAHHLQWDEHQPSPAYQFVDLLGQQSAGLILLTATPEQLGQHSHFARLRLLDPDRFYNYEVFIEEEKRFEPVAHAARLLLEQKIPDRGLQENLKRLLKHDNVEDLLQRINDPEQFEATRQELLNVLLDHHGTGRILFRNSRHTVKGFPQRQCYAYALSPATGTAGKKIIGLADDPRYCWLVQQLGTLADQQEKALLICHKAQTALDLAQLIKQQTGMHTPVFHEGMTILERDRAAAFFQDEESNTRLLICSEIGSEGRNFQFVHHLILFDLPDTPDLLQQRIGRLDRIGQKHLIQIHVPYIKNTAQETMYRWYQQGLDAFRSNCSAAQRVYMMQKADLDSILQSDDGVAIDAFIEKTRVLSGALEEQLQLGRDQLLEINSCNKQIAEQLIAHIKDLEQGEVLWSYMEQLFDCYGVETEFHSRDCFIIKPGNHMRIAHFPELPEQGVTITINREIALAREDIQFLTWEHPLVTAAIDLILSSEIGNAALSIVRYEGMAAGQFLLETLFIVECSAPAELQIGRFLPATPIRIVIDQENNDLSDKIDQFNHDTGKEQIETRQIVDFMNTQHELLHNMLGIARSKAEETMQALIKQCNRNMLDLMNNEIQRLERLKKVNSNIKQVEIDQQQAMLEESHDNINSARLKLDAVRFIVCS